jgi:hypothetical protein
MRGDGSGAGDMPTLDAFDQEFGREPVAILRRQRRGTTLRPLVGMLLAGAIISVPTFAWLKAEGRLGSNGGLQPMAMHSASREGTDEQIDRLLRQVAALKQEISELTQAQQQAVNNEANRSATPLSFWYSDLAALNFGTGGQPRPAAVAPPARRSAIVRPKRDNGATPLSLDAPQQDQ